MKRENYSGGRLGGIATMVALLLLLVPGRATAQPFECSNAEFSPYPDFVETGRDHRRHAPRAQGIAHLFTAFYAVFDDDDDDDGDARGDLRLNPEYVSYELRGVAPGANGDHPEPAVSITRPRDWYSSREIVAQIATMPGVTRPRLDNSYDGIGTIWNRGHLAMSDHAQRISAEAACNTHQFLNASPQAQDLNQGPWQHLENYSAAASNKFGRIWVIAGPIFNRATPRLTIGDAGEPQVEVPDAFFKVLVREDGPRIETLAFIFEQPNRLDAQGRPVPGATWVNCSRARALNHVYDPRPQLVSIRAIERRTGIRFFPGRPGRAALVDARATRLWPVETRFWDPGRSVCAGQRSVP